MDDFGLVKEDFDLKRAWLRNGGRLSGKGGAEEKSDMICTEDTGRELCCHCFNNFA